MNIRTPTAQFFISILKSKNPQGCVFFYNSPHLVGGGEESKGLRAREENQRRVKKMEGLGVKKGEISVG